MNQNKKKHSNSKKPNSPEQINGSANQVEIAPSSTGDATMQRIVRFVEASNYEKALDLLNSAARSPEARNARGVCLLRLGRYQDAMRLYRDLVMAPGGTWLRGDVPLHQKFNYAVSLLLGGHPAGCLEVLADINEREHPMNLTIRAAIRKWEASLPFFARLNWKFGKIEPANHPVRVDFLPGDFGFPVSRTETTPPTSPPGTSLRTAV